MRARCVLVGAVGAALLLGGCGGASHHGVRGKLPAAAQIRYSSDKSVNTGAVGNASVQGKLLASIPFVPNRDGFAFQNYGFIAGPQLTSHTMREMFGDVVCAGAPSDNCTLTPAAQQWAQSVEDSVIGGHCEGFSVTSLRFYRHELSPTSFGGSTVFSLPFSPTLESEIEYGAVTQFLSQAVQATLTGTPSQVIGFLERALANPNGEVYVLGIASGSGANAEGHAIVPIGVSSQGNGRYQILVYDNNFPGVTRAMTINTATESWSYDTETNPDKAKSVWGGQGSDNEMQLTPLSALVGRHPCPFCGNPSSPGPGGALGAGRMVQVSLGGDPVAHGSLLITTSSGGQLGFARGRFVDTIKGARVLRPFLNEISDAHPEPVYQVPASAGTIKVTLNGHGATGQDAASVHVIGAGYGATVSNLLPSSSSSAAIVVGARGSKLSLQTLGSQPSEAPTLKLGLDQGQGGQELAVTPSRLSPGGLLIVALRPSAKQLSVAGTGSSPVSLSVTSIRATGVHTTQKAAVPVSSKGATFSSSGLFRVG